MNISINVNCADINEAQDVLKKLGVQATVEAEVIPVKATRAAKAKPVKEETPAPAVDTTHEEVISSPRDLGAEFKALLDEARMCITGKGAGVKEKGLVSAIKSQCLAIAGTQDTGAVTLDEHRAALIPCLREAINAYKVG